MLLLVCSRRYIPNVCRRHEDLKQMLDSSKDNLKLEAMKRIIGVSNTASFCMHCYFHCLGMKTVGLIFHSHISFITVSCSLESRLHVRLALKLLRLNS